MPGGFVENIASIPWTLIAVLLTAAACARAVLPRYWIVFTALVGTLALGPFVRIGGVMTYVPTPWALVRYIPILGAARMPTRMAALVMLGLSVLLAFALRGLRERLAADPAHPRRAGAFTMAVAAVLAFEMLPAPHVLLLRRCAFRQSHHCRRPEARSGREPAVRPAGRAQLAWQRHGGGAVFSDRPREAAPRRLRVAAAAAEGAAVPPIPGDARAHRPQ